MDRVLLGESLLGILSLPDKAIPQSKYGTKNRSGSSTVPDVWSRKFSEKTSSTAH